jgi:ribosomal protein S18 acetylase RimI-like enzyme
VEVHHEPPSLTEYLRLRAESGLTPKSEAQAQPALSNSWAWVHIRVDGTAVAMGRVIGDGGWYFHIADVATLPSHQRRGYGRAVLAELLKIIDASAPDDPWVTLFADPAGRPLYESMGFVATRHGCRGMEMGGAGRDPRV